jgi:hypothetical protein
VRYPIIVLALLALLAIGAASARDWGAGPRTQRPELPAIDLRPDPRTSQRASKKPKASKKVAGRRTERRNPRSVPASPRPSAVSPTGRGGPPAAAPGRAQTNGAGADDDDGAHLREDSAATPTRRPAPKPVAARRPVPKPVAARDDRGAAPVSAPPPATAGGGDDDEGADGSEGDDGVDSDVGGDADD